MADQQKQAAVETVEQLETAYGPLCQEMRERAAAAAKSAVAGDEQKAERERFKALRAAFAGRLEFAADCFEAGDTVDAAKLKLVPVLEQENKDLREAKEAGDGEAVPFVASDRETEKEEKTDADGPKTYNEAMALVLTELGKAGLGGQARLKARSEAARVVRERFPNLVGG